jgi:hypothetical protein
VHGQIYTGDPYCEVGTVLAVISKTGTVNPTLAGQIDLTVAICYSESQLYHLSRIIIRETCLIKSKVGASRLCVD